MKSIYYDSGIPEKIAREKFFFPECIMMENAASAMEELVLQIMPENLLIFCGSGNNGGDGYALSRRLFGKIKNILLVSLALPKTSEAQIQKKMAEAIGVKILSWDEEILKKLDSFIFGKRTVLVDCIYGSGFHGELSAEAKKICQWALSINARKIACDIPSGIDREGVIHTYDSDGKKIAFPADYTVTMGALKSALYTDDAKDFRGEISLADLGISSAIFESLSQPSAFLLEECDIRLPYRKKKSVHKGNFGHALVITGEKPGAAVIAATAALAFGAGLVSLLTQEEKVNFFMNPELMLSTDFPEKTSALLLGSGFGRKLPVKKYVDYIFQMEKPAAVLDADFFYVENLQEILRKLNEKEDSRIILTPHPKELNQLLRLTGIADISLSETCEKRMQYGRLFAEKYPHLTLIAKGAITYVFTDGKIYVCDQGSPALAKAGSGDVLAGLCLSLLSQGYSAKDAALTSVFMHGRKSQEFEENYACTPLSLISKLESE